MQRPAAYLARILLLAVFCLSVFSVPAHAAFFYVEDGIGGTFNIKHKTLLDQRFYHVFRQRLDFSCGSAALATLLTYNYGRPVDEKSIISSMIAKGNAEKIRKEGFSLLDMKNYLQSMGLHANGYRDSLNKLVRVGIPAIVLINKKGYMHFVVVQGVTQDKVLYGDPAQGKKIVNRKDFEKMWNNGILFVIDDELPETRRTFNTVGAWNVMKPRDAVMPLPNTDLANFTLLTSFAPNSFKSNGP